MVTGSFLGSVEGILGVSVREREGNWENIVNTSARSGPQEPFKRETAYLATGATEKTGGVLSQ